MRPIHLAAVIALVGSCSVPPTTAHREPLNGGAPEDGHPATVFLFWTDGFQGIVCSGSVIAPRVVVSAKHCFASVGTAGWTVNVGPRGDLGTHTVVDVLTTEGPSLENEDIAVVVTGTAIDVTPYEVRRDFAGLRPADEVQLTGYGENPDDGNSGRKYTGQAGILAFGPIVEGGIGDAELLIEGGAAACAGDSGGTVEDGNGRLMGVIVRGADVDCGEAIQTVATRVDHFLDLIDQGLTEANGCAPTGPEMCDGVDDDCDGVVDALSCGAIGAPCSDSSTCLQGQCQPVANQGYAICSLPCDVRHPLEGCPPTTFCQAFDCQAALCIPGTPQTVPVGQPCEIDLNCAGAFCRDPADGAGRRCMVPCQTDDECGAGSRCAAAPAACGACVPVAEDPTLIGFGLPCAGDDTCASGRCGEDDDGTFCTQECGSCPDGYHCEHGACSRGELADDQGVPCAADDDCLTGLCAHWPEGGSCTRFCGEADPCPDGLECTPVGADRAACKPTKAIVGQPCEVNEDCLTGSCGHFEERTDACTQTCAADHPCPEELECVEVAGLGLCAPPPGEDSTYGCGCRAAGAHQGGWWGLLTLGLLGMIVRRGSRRPRSGGASRSSA